MQIKSIVILALNLAQSMHSLHIAQLKCIQGPIGHIHIRTKHDPLISVSKQLKTLEYTELVIFQHIIQPTNMLKNNLPGIYWSSHDFKTKPPFILVWIGTQAPVVETK